MSDEAARLLQEFVAAEPLSGHDLDRRRWFAFVIQAHRDGANPDSGPCRRWLIEQAKWAEDHAEEYASQYNFARELLAAYDTERAAKNDTG